jgi:hypothetical protein
MVPQPRDSGRGARGASATPAVYGMGGAGVCSAEFDPNQASPRSGRRFLAPLIAEPRRRIAGDRPAMAEPGSIE